MKRKITSFIFFCPMFFAAVLAHGQALISADPLADYDASTLTSLTGFRALNGITAYKVQYTTVGSDMKLDTASGLVVLPDDLSIRSLVAYQHGTSDYDDVPSRLNGEATLTMVLAGQGYIAIAADYLGMGDSRGFHPYVHAATEASAGVDLLLATNELMSRQGFQSLEHIFITGYSQGGHGAMAMAQAIQERETDDLWVTAAAPLSGPYSISGTMLDVITSDSLSYFFPAYAVYTMLGYQEVYGSLYQSLEDAFKNDFVDMIDQFYRKEIGVSALNSFLVQELVIDHGGSVPSRIFNEAYLNEIRSDTNHLVRQLLAENDTYKWIPQFPMRMFYCTADDQVSYLNSLVAEEFMQNGGASDVDAIDVSPTSDHGECVLPAALATLQFFNGFKTVSTVNKGFSEIAVYPNPASSELNIDLKYGAFFDARILNMQGKLVQDIRGQRESALSIQNLLPGMYLIQINTSDGQVFFSKFLVQR